jgi:clan AA aspartic protease (TIGR02281 family)
MSDHDRALKKMSFFKPLMILAVGLFALLLTTASAAEIYKWKDQQGRLHFAQDLSQVPPQYRAQAESGAQAKPSRPKIQRYESAPAAKSPRARTRGSSLSKESTVYRVKVTPSGNSMIVNVRLNDDVIAPFVIDTGATDVVIPVGVAKKLGVNLDTARTQQYRTANGLVESEVIVLESVDLGGARIQNVPASVSKSMSIGLLGLSYFNHFRYNVDPVAGVVTLERNGMAEEGRIRGGRSESQWRNAFRGLNRRFEKAEVAIDESTSNGSRKREKLQARLEEAERQLEVLEDEADDARVPMRWRD